MTKDEALELALEALEKLTDTEQTYEALDLGDKAITTIKQALAAPTVQEPVGEVREEKQRHFDDDGCVIGSYSKKTVTSGVYKLPHGTKLYTTPPAAQRQWVGLTERELELIDGMIAVQLDHAARCDSIANRTMAEKQKGWDMERVALLQKLKEKNT